MQCVYCGATYPGSARGCIACNLRLLQVSRSWKLVDGQEPHHKPRSYSSLSHLQFNNRFRLEPYWRTHLLTGFQPPNSATAPQRSAGTLRGSIPVQPCLNHEQPGIDPINPPSTRSGSKHPEQHLHRTPAPRRLASRLAAMVGVFVIGTAVGISAAWWMHQDTESASLSASQKPYQSAVVSAPEPAQSGRSNPLRGINPAELPYDGAHPSLAEPVQQEPQRAAVIQAQGDMAIPGMSSSINEVEPEFAPEIKAPTPAASPKSSVKTRTQVKQKTPASETKSEPKRQSSTSTVAKEREIERIKQQADKELQRKLEIGRAAEEARMRKQQATRSSNRPQLAATRDSREMRVRKILAKCERNPNFFRREQCKWQLCSGKWGKEGCPSYSKQASSAS